MLKIQNPSQLNLVTDVDILDLLRLRFGQLDMNVSMFIVGLGDSISDIGFCILTNLFNDVCYPDPDFEPCFEVLEDHGGCYEMLFILSDGDDGIEIFIPKGEVDPMLLAMCSQFALVLN